MTTIGELITVDVVPEGLRCAEETDYKFTIVPNCSIESGDSLQVVLPDDVILPRRRFLECSGQRYKILSIDCVRVSDHEIRIQFTSVSNINAGTQFWFEVDGIQNPISMKKTDPFQQMFLYSSSGNKIASYYDSRLYL